ncbi:MAG: hypothetical protein KKH97_02370 [Proteobacteria bacterium]|nr:hypothetical protein [Pseudomonadota bacterium]MBU1713097.1 hypothetical protein [Pseudomonadota bacterium]
MNIKICLIILTSAFGLLIVGAIIGNILESNGTLETLGPKGITAVKLTYFILFCVMGFTLVPIALRYFITMQLKIGNGEFILIKWIQAHEQAVICGFWSLFFIGLCIAVPAAIKNGFFK